MEFDLTVVAEALPDVKALVPKRYGDERGFLSEVWHRRALEEAGLDFEPVQENHSVSERAGTVRGLHFQAPPHAQAKLVRVVRGAAFDVAVDLRRGSPSYGRHAAVVLSADAWNQIYIPEGFAHGFCTLEPRTELVYKLSGYYSPESEGGLLWNDPAVGIEWPVDPERAVLSDKDRGWPPLAGLGEVFA
ncbi:MAG: dTDP-4-dehydrorhamnose 3,5-epimerase [Gemmatimonadota bacterium]